FEADGQWSFVPLKSALGNFKRSFSNANRLYQTICGTQSIKLVIEDTPKPFFTLHHSSPALAYSANQSRGEILGSERQGLPFISGYIATHEEARRSDCITRRRQLFAISSSQRVPYAQCQRKLGCG